LDVPDRKARTMTATTSLRLTAEDVVLLRSVVSFASESDTYHDDDEALDRLYRRLDNAIARLAAATEPGEDR
jgi:hypothetical protein